MGKVDFVSAAKVKFAQDQDAAVQAFGEACYEGGASEQKASDGTFTQEDIDAAVAKAKAEDAQALSDAVAAVQAQLDEMTAKEQAEEQAVAALQAKVDQIKALLG